MSSCSAFVRAVPAWNSFACTTVLTQSELLLHVVRLHLLLFSLCQSCSCLEFVCLHYCSASSELFLPGIRLHLLLFSLCQGCSCLEFVCLHSCSACVRTVPAWKPFACPTVQPLSGLFLPGLLVCLLLFNLCHAVLTVANIPFCFRSPLLSFQIKMLPAYAFSPSAILLSAPSCRFLSLCAIH